MGNQPISTTLVTHDNIDKRCHMPIRAEERVLNPPWYLYFHCLRSIIRWLGVLTPKTHCIGLAPKLTKQHNKFALMLKQVSSPGSN